MESIPLSNQVAAEAKMDLKEGVYIQLAGPTFETPGEFFIHKNNAMKIEAFSQKKVGKRDFFCVIIVVIYQIHFVQMYSGVILSSG